MPRRTKVKRVPRSSLARRSVVAAIVFALVPWVTLGFGSALAFALAAAFLRDIGRRATVLLSGSAAVYAAALAVFFVTVDEGPDDSLSTAAAISLVVMVVVAGIEAIICSPLIASAIRGPKGGYRDMLEDERADLAHDPAVRLAIRQRERRSLAREILRDDRALAATLHIGRPDLDRDFADGGLIDVNNCPTWVFASLPGVDVDMAERIVSARNRLDGLRSPADLVVEADVPTEVVDALKDVLVFLPLDES